MGYGLTSLGRVVMSTAGPWGGRNSGNVNSNFNSNSNSDELQDVELGVNSAKNGGGGAGGGSGGDTFAYSGGNIGSSGGSTVQLVAPSGGGVKNHHHDETPNVKKRIFHQLNLDVLPRLANYRKSLRKKRPSLGELYGDETQLDGKVRNGDSHVNFESAPSTHKLGWIEGVLIPCLLNTWGVMLFLRLSWVTGQAGIWQSQVIILISTVVCVLTTLSLSAITTNGEIKGGGIYFIVSRSLGAEFGASVGVIFAFANTVAASMNTIGFCESLNDLLSIHGAKIIDGGVNDIRLVGIIAIFVMILICAAGIEWESKAQNVLVVLIIAAMFDFLIGAILGPTSNEQIVKGFTGFKAKTLVDNWGPDYRFSEAMNQNFFSVFAIFFPCVTGLQAGANISGDLKDPGTAIPKGTLLSLLVSMSSYSIMALFSGLVTARDASGNISEYASGKYMDCEDRHCAYGLQNSYSVMQLASLSGGIVIYIGCFAATLSTALTNLLSVPRLMQALGNDQIYPGLIFFSKGYGKNGEPFRGYIIVFFASSAFLLIANLNVIAPLISNFYLASYALINFCTFHAALIQPLGWRPQFRYYNCWLSLTGFVLCVLIMLLIDVVTTILTFIMFLVLYFIVVYRNPDVNWGSSTQAQIYKRALSSALKLNDTNDHVKNYCPQVLVLSGLPQTRPSLIRFANFITKNNSLLLTADILHTNLSYKERACRFDKGNAWLRDKKIKGFFNTVQGDSFESAAKSAIQASGIGKLRPDVCMMGFKKDWRSCPHDELLAYFHVLRSAFENRMSVTILRLPWPLNCIGDDEVISANDIQYSETKSPFTITGKSYGSVLPVDSNFDLSQRINFTNNDTEIKNRKNLAYIREEKAPVFEQKQHGTIDVWWLYDDGGLTVLLPYIISSRNVWSDCSLRIFTLVSNQHEVETEEKNLANLLSKFRIRYTSIKVLSEFNRRPQKETILYFHSLLDNFKDSDNLHIKDEELNLLSEKTNRIMKLHEFLQENSKEAALVVASLPIPRKDIVSAPLYMAWLELLTNNMPPFLLTRGNQTDVLTFYS